METSESSRSETGGSGAVRRVDGADGVLDGHELRSGLLQVDVGAAERRQDERLGAGDDVRPVELGGHLHGQVGPAHRGLGRGGVGDRRDEVAAEREPDLDLAAPHRLDRLHGVEPVPARRLERELGAERVEEAVRHPLPDAHRAVALHVAVPADRGGARARLADVPAEQQEVDDLLDRVDALAVLRQPHRPRDDHAVGGEVAVGQLGPSRPTRQAGGREHLLLVERREVRRGARRGRACAPRGTRGRGPCPGRGPPPPGRAGRSTAAAPCRRRCGSAGTGRPGRCRGRGPRARSAGSCSAAGPPPAAGSPRRSSRRAAWRPRARSACAGGWCRGSGP